MRLKKVVIALISFVMVMSILSVFSNVKADGEEYTLGIVRLRKSGYGYAPETDQAYNPKRTIWKIVSYESGNVNYDKALYCIRAGQGFGDAWTTGNTSGTVAYSEIGDLKLNRSTITSTYNQIPMMADSATYSKVLWILDNLYIPGTTNKETFLKNIPTKSFMDTDSDVWTEMKLTTSELDDLTDDDIETIQQAAIWYFTNSENENYHTETLPILYQNNIVNVDATYQSFANKYDDDSNQYGTWKQEYANSLYKYLITEADKNATYTGVTNTSETPLTLNKDNAVTITKNSNGYLVGPFKIDRKNAGSYFNFSAVFKNQDDSEITNYTIIDENEHTISNIEDTIGSKFYIVIPSENNNIEKVTLRISLDFENISTKFLSTGEGTYMASQPIVLVEKVPGDYSDTVSSEIFDLALRKFITKIDDTVITTREPQISDSEKQALATGTTSTAQKVHPKDALLVNTNSLVTYTIRVYNEGDVKGIAKEITDYLPEGLEFYSSIVDGVDYGWKLYKEDGTLTTNASEAKIIRTDFLKNEVLDAFNKDTKVLDYADVKVICKVVATEKTTDQSLKNIAAITNATDENGNEIKDRDSVPNELTKNERDNYPFINDSKDNYEDDDDFENLRLPGKNIDLALRKFITKINSENITNRVPTVDVSTIKNEGTATYNHTKLPLAVEIGDTVIYTIRVYNEGDIDGYVSEITDHLPEYLEYDSENEVNTKFGWTEVSESNGRKYKTNITSKVNEANYATQTGEIRQTGDTGTLLKKYEEGNTKLSYIDVQIACIIKDNAVANKKITNIAEITGMTDVEGTQVNPDRDSTSGDVNVPSDNDLPTYKDDEIGKKDYIPGQEDDDDFEKVQIKELDLALRKFITKVNSTVVPTREPNVITSSIATTGTATYNHTKEPVNVKIGDIVTYTIRVYNEGDIDGYVEEITDFLPEYLEFIDDSIAVTDEEKAAADFNKNYLWQIVAGSNRRRIKTEVTSREKSSSYKTLTGIERDNTLLTKYEEGNTVLSYIDVEVKCKVKDNSVKEKKITNIAEITKMADSKGNEVKTDRDSTADSLVDNISTNGELPTDSELPTYKDDEIGKKEYIPGQEDDDDFEKLQIKIFDLALKKFITEVNTTDITTRIPTVYKNTDKTLRYSPTPEPVGVKNGDYVTYTIRIYNEGEIDGYASEITDDLPEGLEFLPANAINKEYRWIMRDEEGNEVDDLAKAKVITTDYLSKEQETATRRNNLIKAYDPDASISRVYPFNPDYKEVLVVFKVIEPNTSTRILVNVAQISDDQDKDGNPVEDIDSTPHRDEEYNFEDETKNEDDIDYEHVRLLYFDLALRKFITGVNDKVYNNRFPVVSYEDGKLKYTTKQGTPYTKEVFDPVSVENNDTVIYTIRVYNEGKIAGYAKEVMDDIPEGLEFLPENDLNIEYRWIMYKEVSNSEKTYDYEYADKKYVETEDAKEADIIVTDYLSKRQSDLTGRDGLLKPFDDTLGVTEDNPDYRDLKVAFKVTEPNTSDRIIVNTAEISNDEDEYGKDIEDVDSTPGNDKDKEDDIDKEHIYVKYFDLSLLKWVSQAIVTIDGKTTVTETGHTGEENPEPVVKVELKEKNINKVNVKFKYKIKITNEGEIAGYAKEVTDYIPEGLKFVAEDNPTWYEREPDSEGKIRVATKDLEDTLLKPGESATVEIILTWINDKNNMGLKVNVAEISEDYNESHTPDIDSTPDNEKPGEDDIDDAPVILTPQTGAERIYFILGGIILVAVIAGVGLIKKYVIE